MWTEQGPLNIVFFEWGTGGFWRRYRFLRSRWDYKAQKIASNPEILSALLRFQQMGTAYSWKCGLKAATSRPRHLAGKPRAFCHPLCMVSWATGAAAANCLGALLRGVLPHPVHSSIGK